MLSLHLYRREVYGGGGGGAVGGDVVGDDAVEDDAVSGGDAVGNDAAQFAGRHRRRLVDNVVGDAGNAERHPHFSAADAAV